jgi:predicted MFS family arabinose efflux permease
MSISGTVSIVSNGFLLQFLSKRWAEDLLVRSTAALMAASFVVYGHVPAKKDSLPWIMLIVIPMTAGSSIAYTVLSSQMSKAVTVTERATAIGISHACRSLCNLVAPSIGSWLFLAYDCHVLGYTCAILTLFAIAFALTFPVQPAISKHE